MKYLGRDGLLHSQNYLRRLLIEICYSLHVIIRFAERVISEEPLKKLLKRPKESIAKQLQVNPNQEVVAPKESKRLLQIQRMQMARKAVHRC